MMDDIYLGKKFGSVRDGSMGVQLTALLFFSIVGGSLALGLSVFLGRMLWGLPMEAIEQVGKYGGEGIRFLKLTQVLTSLGLFAIPAWLMAKLYSGNASKILGYNSSPQVFFLLVMGVLMVLQMPWINLTAEWNRSMVFPEAMKELYESMLARENEANALIEKLLYMPGIPSLLSTLFVVAVVPAVAEELMFRGGLQTLFVKAFRNPHLAIWCAGFVFSFIHFQFFGFLPRMLIGVLFGYLYLWSGNLWYPIAAHFVNNALAVLQQFALSQGMLEISTDALGSGDWAYLETAISLALSIPLLVWIRSKFLSIKHHKSSER
jgi:membrane protease YdiL (CAAX protease family)